MSFKVRIYGYQPLRRLATEGITAGTDSVLVLRQPYLWKQSLTSNGTTSVVSTAAPVPAAHSTDPTIMLRVEVPDGQSIRYEVSTNGQTPVATTDSPLLTGRDDIEFGANWLFAFIDASGT